METPITAPAPTPTETPAPAPTENPAPSGLPSEQPSSEDFAGFQMTDEVKAKFVNGKLFGKYDSFEDMFTKHKDLEDFKSNTVRAQKNLESAPPAVNTNAVLQSLIPEFMQNGMVLTPEMEAKATEAKLDVRDLKIGALELRETTKKAYGIVGGEKEYSSMISWAKENMNDTQKVEFNKDLSGSMSEYAIRGLHAEFKDAVAKGTADRTPRIEGQPANKTIQPYADRRELFKDKEYIDSPRGKRDTVAVNAYRARLRATPNAVIYGS